MDTKCIVLAQVEVEVAVNDVSLKLIVEGRASGAKRRPSAA